MELLGILIGIILWPTAVIGWLVIWKVAKLPQRVVLLGLVVLLLLAALGIGSTAWWVFVGEPREFQDFNEGAF